MPQFFVNETLKEERECVIGGDDARHLVRVRRVTVGEHLVLRDELGLLFQAEVTVVGDLHVHVRVTEKLEAASHQPECVLLASLLKGSRFDDVVRQATEVGVTRIVPVISERTIVDPSGKEKRLLDRWKTIAAEASKQCLRPALPEIDEPVRYAEAISKSFSPLRLLALPVSGRRVGYYRDKLEKGCAVMIGPEGGFSAREVDAALHAGWNALHVGQNCLRAETAAVVIPALLIDASLAFQEDCDG